MLKSTKNIHPFHYEHNEIFNCKLVGCCRYENSDPEGRGRENLEEAEDNAVDFMLGMYKDIKEFLVLNGRIQDGSNQKETTQEKTNQEETSQKESSGENSQRR